MSDPQKLIATCLDGALTASERGELTAWLKAHPDNMRAFVKANVFEQQIRQAVQGQVQREAAMAMVERDDFLQPTPFRVGHASSGAWFRRWWRGWVALGAGTRAWVLAFSMVSLAAGIFYWAKSPATHGATSNAVAMLARTVDAVWAPGTVAPREGSALPPGWLRLKSGMAQVVFYSGARLVMEGPVELNLVSPSEAVCPTGRLLAEVPQPARGFRLKTDQFKVVDLGTAFGINATHKRTEVHVFKGEVEVLPGATPKQALVEGQGAAAESNTALKLMAASTEAFKSLFELQQRSLAAEAVRYDQWRMANLRLNRDPSMVIHLDFEDFTGAEWALPNSAASNQLVEEITRVGCQRAAGRWREKPALEFQSVNDRVRFVVPGEYEALTTSAWVRVKGLDREFNSLLMCDGFEPGTVHWLIRNDGVLGLTVFGTGLGNYQIVASPPVVALELYGMWIHLAAVVDGKTRQVAHYLNGNLVSRQTVRMGPPYRIGPAELGNWNVSNDSAPAASLIRNFSGSLDEFALFGRALTDAQIRELYFAGKPDE